MLQRRPGRTAALLGRHREGAAHLVPATVPVEQGAGEIQQGPGAIAF